MFKRLFKQLRLAKNKPKKMFRCGYLNNELVIYKDNQRVVLAPNDIDLLKFLVNNHTLKNEN